MNKEIKFGDILKINGFKYNGGNYDRDDGIQIAALSDPGYTIVYSDGDTIYCNDKTTLIGELSLLGIINRLF